MYIHSTDLKRYLENNRITQTEVANGIRVMPSTICVMCNCNRNLSDHKKGVRRVFEYLKRRDPDWLLHLKDGPNLKDPYQKEVLTIEDTRTKSSPSPIFEPESECLNLIKSEILKIIQASSADILMLIESEREDILKIIDICKSGGDRGQNSR